MTPEIYRDDITTTINRFIQIYNLTICTTSPVGIQGWGGACKVVDLGENPRGPTKVERM